jgi:hypothetical protein
VRDPGAALLADHHLRDGRAPAGDHLLQADEHRSRRGDLLHERPVGFPDRVAQTGQVGRRRLLRAGSGDQDLRDETIRAFLGVGRRRREVGRGSRLLYGSEQGESEEDEENLESFHGRAM